MVQEKEVVTIINIIYVDCFHLCRHFLYVLYAVISFFEPLAGYINSIQFNICRKNLLI